MTTCGTGGHRPAVSSDAEAVRRLRAAGAVIIGKTNVPELMIFPFTESLTFGATRNPWAPSRTCGGSSGGSAVAVSSSMVTLATGSDGGGSIRIPSEVCGICGFKPTHGVVPGATTTMIKQRTLKNAIKTTGVGLHTGVRVELHLRPAAPDSGIVFHRIDLPQAVDSLSDLIDPKRDLIAGLGIFVIDLDDSLAEAIPSLRSKRGVIVAGLLGEEPATLADLQVGDVVRAVNGKSVTSTDGFRRILAGFNPGDSVVLEVERQSVLMYVAFEME